MLAALSLPDRRLVRPHRRLLLEHGAGLPRDLLHQFARACAAAASATSPATISATTGCSRSSPWARAGTTTTTPVRAACARAFAGGRSTRPTTSSRRCRGPAWCGTSRLPPREAVRLNEHRLGSRVIERAAAQLAASFDTERIAWRDRRGERGFRSVRHSGQARKGAKSHGRRACQSASATIADPP